MYLDKPYIESHASIFMVSVQQDIKRPWPFKFSMSLWRSLIKTSLLEHFGI